ncbi:porin family protein [Aestuariibaculum suncheonense]|uniref:Outer membrane protein beta-barrel domain-containing protein n=1 Tax=Aestuariibaculum suncheonense TaxID=1028745 RepID=A0A8J6Q539_9FLAO|nr:outer membrane beta-barrel protein [Aestuariibaculum suncheonense]MBD0834055.1 hypothetical protein [Aestuariibaculum suncheonense]
MKSYNEKENFHFVAGAIISFYKCFSQSNFKIGANIGGQISSLRGFDYDQPDNKFELVPVLGVNFEVCVTSSLSVITAFNYERWKKERGVYYYGGYSSYEGTVKESYDFFNIPLLMRYKFGNKKLYFLEGGGFLNYFNKGNPSGYMPLFIDFEDYNFGLALGLGRTFYLNDNFDITLQLRNELGLSDVNKYETMVSGNVKTNTFKLIATFNVNL